MVDSFSGTLDGGGFAVRNLWISGREYLGLFGTLETGASVRNLAVTGVTLTGSGDYVGGLAGLNRGDVTRCKSLGSLAGTRYVGGLTGCNVGSITASSYQSGEGLAAGSVTGTEYVGGGWWAPTAVTWPTATAPVPSAQQDGSAASSGLTLED